jgi:hypothetical protein
MMSSTRTSDISAELIARENVPVVWMLVKDRLARAIEEFGNGESTSEDLYDNLLVGRSQLWIINDVEMNILAIATTRILRYPRKKRLLVDMLAGEGVREFLHLLSKAEAWMQQFGATETEAHVRPALARILEKHAAFKRSRVVVFREPQHVDLSEAHGKLEQG